MQLLPFALVAAVIVLTPGVDMALVTKNALGHGRGAALWTALGVNAGVFVWAVSAALGLAALVAESATLFTAIKLAGAAYLLYVGILALVRSWRRPRSEMETSEDRAAVSAPAAFRQGLVCNVLNPKIAILFTSLLPQFTGPHGSALDFLALGLLFNALGLTWLLTYAVIAARGRNALSKPRVRQWLDRLSGVVLVGLGVRIALERRA